MSHLYDSYVICEAKVMGSDIEHQCQPRELFVASKRIGIPNSFVPDGIILSQTNNTCCKSPNVFLVHIGKKMFLQIRVFKCYKVAYEKQKCIELEMRLYDLKVRADVAQRKERNCSRATPWTCNQLRTSYCSNTQLLYRVSRKS